MTDLINQISINGESTTFYNYANSVTKLEQGPSVGIQSYLFTAQFGADNNIWAGAGETEVRFPVPWETLTGAIAHTGSSESMGPTTRFKIRTYDGSNYNKFRINSTTASSGTVDVVPFTLPASYASTYRYPMGITNDYAYCEARFNADTSTAVWWYSGWLKDATYTGSSFPRSAVAMYGTSSAVNTARRVTVENSTSSTNLLIQNPTLSCSVATPAADSTDVIIRDSTAPNNYIGKLWNMMILPSTAVVGKIYKNTGIDPDTGQVETDQKAFWMCVGTWGTDKIGMRVWTDNII